MNRREYLLACLAEECAEVQHLIGKALRFGIENKPDGREEPNSELIVRELCDIMAIWDMLEADGSLKGLSLEDLEGMRDAKIAKVESLMDYSREIGTLQD